MLRNTSRIAVLGLAALALNATSAMATQFSIGGNLGSSVLFDQSDGPNGATDVSAFLGGVSFFDFSFTTSFDIVDGGSFVWTGNNLTADTSDGFGLASGAFSGGGTLSLSGDLTNFGLPVTSGSLLTGTVSAFTLNENSAAENFLDSAGATFTPTGGWLFANGHVVNPYTFSVSIIGATQGGGGVEDFQSDVQFTQSSTWGMIEIPEPSSIVLLAGLGMGLLIRKNR